jgi:hypothetical protein
MNSKFHKAQAEALIREFNHKIEVSGMKSHVSYLLDLAHVHALLANVKDDDE